MKPIFCDSKSYLPQKKVIIGSINSRLKQKKLTIKFKLQKAGEVQGVKR